jgi:dTDP-4-dehydrorhamnose reductase
MRILLTGADGKVGRAWRRLLSSSPDAHSFTSFPPVKDCDLATSAGQQALVHAVTSEPFDLVIHAAAMTDVDACEREPERAVQINAVAVEAISRACAAAGAGLIFYSTDYVFDGTGPKGEEAKPAPLNVYGRTKLAAEESIRQAGGEHLIVRINVPLAPPEDGDSFYSFVARGLSRGETLRIVTDQWNNPLDTDRIARWSLEAWTRGQRGVLHLGGGTYATRFDIARLIAAYLGVDSRAIIPAKTADLRQAAARPARGGLVCARQADLFGTAPDLPTILKALPKPA